MFLEGRQPCTDAFQGAGIPALTNNNDNTQNWGQEMWIKKKQHGSIEVEKINFIRISTWNLFYNLIYGWWKTQTGVIPPPNYNKKLRLSPIGQRENV